MIRFALAGALLAGTSAPAFAETTQADLESQIQAMQAELVELRSQQNEQWMNERRAEEVRSLVHEVLQDADTRASLLADGATAGISEKGKIYLQSADGSWKIEFGGQIQFRYIYNFQDARDAAGSDRDAESGFQLRRAKFKMKGHIADPKLYYELAFDTDRDDGDTGTETALVGYKWDNGLYIQAGVFKLPFARQELISSSRQTAVDRSQIVEHFTLNRSEQIQVGYKGEMVAAAVSASDGANNDWSSYKSDQSHDFALTARADVKIAGEWGQMKDELAWAGEDFAAFVGAAMHYENGDTGASGINDYFAWTVDGLVEADPFSVTAAVFGASNDDAAAGGASEVDQFGFYVQGAANLNDTWAPFVRYEWLDDDTTAEELQSITAGVNYFLKKHNAKFTADVVYKFAGDGEPGTEGMSINGGSYSSGLGLDDSPVIDDEDQIALRIQFQLLF